jgi:hypothetical protein
MRGGRDVVCRTERFVEGGVRGDIFSLFESMHHFLEMMRCSLLVTGIEGKMRDEL